MKKIFCHWQTWLCLLLNTAVLVMAIIEKNVVAALWIVAATWWFIETLYFQDKYFSLRKKCVRLETELLRTEIKRYGVEIKNLNLLTKECDRLMMRQKHFARLRKGQSK